MRKGIIAIIVGVGLIYANLGFAQELKANATKEKKFATQNYYKHEKDAHKKQSHPDEGYNTSGSNSDNAENEFLSKAQIDLPINYYFARDHR